MAALKNIEEIVARVLDQDHYAIARAISLIEAGGPARSQLFEAFLPHIGRAEIIGVTGPPGVGKSTLVNACITAFRKQDKSIGVLAVDPSSPVTGGAILGDRIRMKASGTDSQVYIRSLAARGHPGGLSTATFFAINLLDAAGKDIIIVETVGAGQSETEVSKMTDVNVVVLAPGLGDEVQAMKSGILETADILVVNKSDQPDAGRAASHLKTMLKLRAGKSSRAPVLLTSAQNNQGIEELIQAIQAKSQIKQDIEPADREFERLKLLLSEIALQVVRDQIARRSDDELRQVLKDIKKGRLDLDAAIDSLLGRAEGTD